MRSDVARCLYKFTNAPIQASISIAYETSERQIATKVVNERDGWLYLGAYNFTFSSPTIQVKLFQDPPKPSPTPTSSQTPTEVVAVPASPTPKAAAAKKTTISCIKGKLTKKVSAVNPKCPAGYKKK
jgi:hypothetical protein